ncbi:sugar ABC transporter permease [Streptomyces sp. NPDC007095]|jgi:arabinogalactan oligomer/maltooligosaccharide transport system permease protein|uniref:carbohydrate ABC transporter permease n=1 Tax=Streptomyces sp. NPDC007095 TaxID=3154482 RepID=UPI000C70F557|nr:sugar ABC transporter permease [Streptomyces sp. S1D4-11]QIY95457.1 sugar ABC transporter permease [Streptomyces sp. S1D4-11]
MTTAASTEKTDLPAPGKNAARPPRVSALRRSWDKYWYAWAMVTPVAIVLTVLVLYPLGYGIYQSLTDANESNVASTIGAFHRPATYKFVGLDNYWHVLSGADSDFYPRLLWTVIWTVSCVTLQVGIGMGLAVLLNRKVRFRGFYRAMLILPWAVPSFIGVFAWRLMLNSQYGVFNEIITAFGLPAQDWLGTPLAQKIAVIMVNVWIGVPFNMVAVLGGLQSIPKELYEAAEMDGASPWQRFVNVTLPGLRPVSNTVILLGCIWTFNMFNVIYLLLGNNTSGDADILVTFAFRKAFTGISDYAGAATYGIIILALLLAFSTFYRRSTLKSEQA